MTGQRSSHGRSQSSNNQRSSYVSMMNITILVVDDDSVSLAVVSAMLRKWSYQVAAVKDPVNALSMLRQRPGQFDLVVTDLHMPQMDGRQLQKHICAEFQVPVIMMSSDDKESVILDSLALGAAFFIVKPINPVDLKNVWQHAIAAKKGRSLQMESQSLSPPQQALWPDRTIGSPSSDSSNARTCSLHDTASDGNYQDRKRKTMNSGGESDDDDNHADADEDYDNDNDGHPHPPAPKKAKVVWTNSLHNHFLQAIRHIGLDKAVPKKILEYMNVPGLTRENVASHLQKYRMFLKRVAEKSASSTDSLSEKTFKSSFATGHGLSLVESAQEYCRLTQQHQVLSQGTTIQPGLGRPVSTLSVTGSMRFSTQAAINNTSMPQLGFTQPNSPPNQSSFHNTSSWTGFGGGTSNCAPSLSTNISLASNGTTVGTSFPKYGYGGTTNHGASNYFSASMNQLSNGYAGIRISSNGDLLGMDKLGNRVGGTSAGGFGFVNGTGNLPAAGNQNSGTGIGDYEIDSLNNGAFSLDNITNSQQQIGGTNNQLQGGDLDQLLNQLLNYDFSTICNILEGGQTQMIEKEGEVGNTEQTSKTGVSNDATSSENQPTSNEQGSWEDDFLESLLGFDSPQAVS